MNRAAYWLLQASLCSRCQDLVTLIDSKLEELSFGSASPNEIQGPPVDQYGFQDWRVSCGQDGGPSPGSYWLPMPYPYQWPWTQWDTPHSWRSFSLSCSKPKSPAPSMVVALDEPQAQAAVVFLPAELPETSIPGTSSWEQEPVLAQLRPLSSLPDDAVLPGSSSPSILEDWKVYQDLLLCVATSLGMQVEFLQENTHKLVDILSLPSPGEWHSRSMMCSLS